MNRGVFITFEGLDGSGKTTQLELLASSLAARGHMVVTTRNPGGTRLGDQIRGLLLNSRSEHAAAGIAPEAEMALMFADRAQSLQEVIRPALEERAIVLCDRYTDSSEAYQGAGRELGVERVQLLHRILCRDQQPDLTILLLPPLGTSLARARRRNQRHLETRGTDENRFEAEGDAFYSRVHAQYEFIAARESGRVLAFRDHASIERIAEEILSAVLDRLTQLTDPSRVPAGAPSI